MATSDETSGQANKPDSKDFVEHLRTVHFGLMAVCLALVVVLNSPTSSSILQAEHELESIVKATNTWDTDLLRTSFLSGEHEFRMQNCLHHIFPRLVSVSLPSGTLTLSVRTFNDWKLVPGGEQNPTLFVSDAEGFQYFNKPTKLEEFKTIWDKSDFTVLCPVELADSAVYYSQAKPTTPIEAKFKIIDSVATTNIKPTRDLVADSSILILQTPTSFQRQYQLGFPKTSTEYAISHSGSLFFAGEINGDILIIPVKFVTKDSFRFRPALVSKFRDSVLSDVALADVPFDSAFYQLERYTAGFQDLSFEQLSRVLHQTERNSKETFQAFGVTFPIESTTRWGTLIIIAIQFYFLLHFVEYGKSQVAVKRDVAWIGIYSSVGAQILFCATTLAVPVGVVIYVCIEAGLIQQMPIRNFILCSFAVTVSLLLSLLTAKEYFKKDTVTPTNPPKTGA